MRARLLLFWLLPLLSARAITASAFSHGNNQNSSINPAPSSRRRGLLFVQRFFAPEQQQTRFSCIN
jgi:hypothetical protein